MAIAGTLEADKHVRAPIFASRMTVTVHFYSYFKDLAGCPQIPVDLAPGSTVGDLLREVYARFPQLAPLRKSLLVAVGVDYQQEACELKDGEEVSLFPPVQGG